MARRNEKKPPRHANERAKRSYAAEEERAREDAPYGGTYGAHGIETRPADYYRNKSGVYGGRPEARGWLPDAATTPVGIHRGHGPKNYKRSDERIREDVNDYLTDDSELDASDIVVDVKNGEVTLNGTVSEKAAKRRAEDLADAVSGVSHVQNNIRVEASGGALHDVP